MGFRCSLCCLVEEYRPTWPLGKELASACAYSTLRYVQICSSTSMSDP